MHPKARGIVLGGVGIGLWLVIWGWATTAGPFGDTPGLSTVHDTFSTAVDLATRPSFWSAVVVTVWISLLSLAIALLIGTAVGASTGYSQSVFAVLDPTLQFLRPLPPVVLIPLLVLTVGPSAQLAVILATLGATWPILIQVRAGVQATDPVALETARALKLSWWRTQFNVVLPSAFPFAATGVRIGAATSLMLTIGAGILVGTPGIGRLVATAQETGQVSTVFAVILWTGFLGMAYATALGAIERIATVNHRSGGRA
ncbi:ABC transporter permease subunit [Streptomyces sp. NPDC093252]|uniref:ABC transporter permease n=1 Tax=Streptomyces sp. NPDC093252 TaxID=3154980 RepID=UPI0034427303